MPGLAPGPNVDPYARQHVHARLDQSELVGSRELMTLAGSLMKRKNEKHAQLGRALVKAVRGELFAKHGQDRDLIALQICGEIINAYPNCDPESVVSCFLMALSRLADDGSDLTPARFRAMLEHWQEKRQLRLNMIDQAVAGKLGEALREREAQAILEAPIPAIEAKPQAPTDYTTLIIQADGDYYLRPINGYNYRKFKSQTALGTELVRLFGANNQTLALYDQRGVKFPMQSLLDAYSTNARAVIYDYVAESTTYDTATGTIRIGYEPLPGSEISPQPDSDVEAWLQQLAGGSEKDLLDLYDWVSSTARERLTSPAAAIVVIGAPDAGKSLLALCLALTWGTVPVSLKAAIDKFNGAILGSPIWHADERMPEDLTDDIFREMVQSRRRLVEPKGRERVPLEGASRIIVTINELEDLCINGATGPDAIQAVSDRLAIFSSRHVTGAVRAALAKLRPDPSSNDVDLKRIAGHLSYVQTCLAPRTQRFLGARDSQDTAKAHLLSAHVDRYGVLFEWLREYLISPEAFEREYSAERRAFAAGHRYPVVTQYQECWVWANELASKLGLKGWEVSKALAPLRAKTQGSTQLAFGNRGQVVKGRYVNLDSEALCSALRMTDAETDRVALTLAVDSRVRKGET